ncbi:MAG: hypothetical protein QGG58_01160 [Chloroflexota bacterium]|jgi:CRP-like cAMP-binding protein|nr:hypothetical protein [Chloroflexota bacterium]
MVRDRLESDPTLGMALFEIAGERLREAQNLAESLAFDAVLSRVANLLLELTGGPTRPPAKPWCWTPG